MKEDELLVRIRATALNRAPAAASREAPPSQGVPDILGLEMAGEVASVGPLRGMGPGDRCAPCCRGRVCGEGKHPRGLAMRIPKISPSSRPRRFPSVSHGVPEPVQRGRLRSGETVLIHAGEAAWRRRRSSCPGGGGISLVTAGPRKRSRGARRWARLPDGITRTGRSPVGRRADRGARVDIVLDFVGAPYFEQNLEVLGRRKDGHHRDARRSRCR